MAAIFYSPEELLQRAQLGAKLKPKERLEVVLWLERTGNIQSYPDGKLAQALGCKVNGIKKLRAEARHALASAIAPEEAMNYMAEFVRVHDLLIAEAIDGMKGAPKFSQAHQGYMKLLMEASSQKVAKLQSIGVIPKELGRLTTVAEKWVATISNDVASVQLASGDSDTGETDEPA